jgi:hypothetical protein
MSRLHARARATLANGLRPEPPGDPLPGDAELDGAVVQSAGRQMVEGVGVSRASRRPDGSAGLRVMAELDKYHLSDEPLRIRASHLVTAGRVTRNLGPRRTLLHRAPAAVCDGSEPDWGNGGEAARAPRPGPLTRSRSGRRCSERGGSHSSTPIAIGCKHDQMPLRAGSCWRSQVSRSQRSP